MGAGYYADLDEARRLAADLEKKAASARAATVLIKLADECAAYRSAEAITAKDREIERLKGILGELGGEPAQAPASGS